MSHFRYRVELSADEWLMLAGHLPDAAGGVVDVLIEAIELIASHNRVAQADSAMVTSGQLGSTVVIAGYADGSGW